MLGLFRVKSPVLLESIERKKALASWWWQRVTSWDFCETHSHGPLCSPNGASPEAVCRHGLPKSIAKTCENHDYSLMENFWKYHQITFKEYTTPSHPARKKNMQTANTLPTLQTQTFFTCTSQSTGIHWNLFTTSPSPLPLVILVRGPLQSRHWWVVRHHGYQAPQRLPATGSNELEDLPAT